MSAVLGGGFLKRLEQLPSRPRAESMRTPRRILSVLADRQAKERGVRACGSARSLTGTQGPVLFILGRCCGKYRKWTRKNFMLIFFSIFMCIWYAHLGTRV